MRRLHEHDDIPSNSSPQVFGGDGGDWIIYIIACVFSSLSLFHVTCALILNSWLSFAVSVAALISLSGTCWWSVGIRY